MSFCGWICWVFEVRKNSAPFIIKVVVIESVRLGEGSKNEKGKEFDSNIKKFCFCKEKFDE